MLFKKQLSISAFIVGIIISAAFFSIVSAQTNEPVDPTTDAIISQITFPISDLGGCTDKATCKTYCDISEHKNTCIEFGERYGLLSLRQAKLARILKDAKGPGGCEGRGCEIYCGNRDHIEECVNFGERHEIMTNEELQIARKLQGALNRGIKLPNNCKTRDECKRICNDTENTETVRACIQFIADADVAPKNFDRALADRLLSLIDTDANVTLEDIKKCRALNNLNNNQTSATDSVTLDWCLQIGFRIGKITEPAADAAREILTNGGPGGCHSEKTCKEYCAIDAHFDECTNYAWKHNLISAEDRQKIEEARKRFKEAYDKAPAEIAQCLKQTVGENILNEILNGTRPPSPRLGELMQKCFATITKPTTNKPTSSGQVPTFIKNLPEIVRICIEREGNIDRFDTFFKEHAGSPIPQWFYEVIRKCMQDNGLEPPNDIAPFLTNDAAPFPANFEKCKQEGGVWTGSICRFPEKPQTFNSPTFQSFFGQILSGFSN